MYKYVGSKEILRCIKPNAKGYKINSSLDIQEWIIQTEQTLDENNEIIATFIIDTTHNLKINDRHLEHVACAEGNPVLSAGEIIFEINNGKVTKITHITNQSTGYCPQINSWKEVDKALKKLDLPFPPFFTQEFIFRICEKCDNINIIKDNFFVCNICESNL